MGGTQDTIVNLIDKGGLNYSVPSRVFTSTANKNLALRSAENKVVQASDDVLLAHGMPGGITNVNKIRTGSGNWGHEGRPLDPNKAYNMWSIPKQWKEYRTDPITSTGKSREDLVKEKYMGYFSGLGKDVSLAPAHIQQIEKRPAVGSSVRKSIEKLKDPDVSHFESGFADLPSAVDDYIKGGTDRKIGDNYKMFIHPDFVTPEKYLPKVDFKEPGKKVFFGDQPSGFTTQGEGTVTNVIRNVTYNQHYENRLTRWLTEKKLIEQAFKEKKISKGRMLQDMETADSHISNIERDMRQLGLPFKVWDDAKQSFRYFGGAYENQFRGLLENMPKEYLLSNPPYKISEGFDKSKKAYWTKPKGHARGGLVSLLRNKPLQKMARTLIPKQFSILTGGLNGS